MRQYTIILALVTLLVANAFGASDLYVDVNAVGTETGTSWANAWTNCNQINWGSVSAGTTVWFSGPSTYTNLTVQTAGTQANPVRIRCSQEPGHNGLVTIRSINSWRDWVTIDGSKDNSFYLTVTNVPNLWIITNNIGIKVERGVYYASDLYKGQVLKFLEITSFTNRTDVTEYNGVTFNAGVPLQNDEIAYCYIHDVGGDSVHALAANATTYDSFVIHHSILWQQDDDAYEGVGCTIHDSIIARSMRYPPLGSDPDGLQTTGNYVRFYNNIVYDMGNSLFQCQGQAPENGTYGHWQVYGNYFYYKDYPWEVYQYPHTTEMELKWYPADASWNRLVEHYDDWVVANNTFANFNVGGWQWEARTPMAGQVGWVSNIYCTNITIVNNLFLSCTNTVLGIPYGEQVQEIGGVFGTNYWFYDEPDVVVNYNLFSTNHGQSLSIAYLGTSWASGEALSAGTSYANNRSATPTIPGIASYDFRPALSDTIAFSRGTNISALALPGWDKDLYGTTRGTTPSIGAAEPDGSAPLLWLSFENDFVSDGYIEDVTGNSRHAYRFGYPGHMTNFPARILASSIPGTNSTGYAGSCLWYRDGWGLYGRSGDYAGITNVSALTNMSYATIMCWGRYNHFPAGESDYSVDANATLISAGDSQGITGSWQLGRFNYLIHLNETRFTILTNGPLFQRLMINFPDASMAQNGDTFRWHHYAVTWNAGVIKCYYDGTPFATNDVSAAVTVLRIGHYAYAAPWIAVACQTHDGDPWLNDEPPPGDSNDSNDYPNHGWLNGSIDDVRIYDRVLTASEVLSIAEGIAQPSGPIEPVASFTGTPVSGAVPLTVSFTDSSANAPTSWAWDFINDGSTDSISQNTATIYETAGTYSVKLTAANAAGTNSVVLSNYITATNPVPPIVTNNVSTRPQRLGFGFEIRR